MLAERNARGRCTCTLEGRVKRATRWPDGWKKYCFKIHSAQVNMTCDTPFYLMGEGWKKGHPTPAGERVTLPTEYRYFVNWMYTCHTTACVINILSPLTLSAAVGGNYYFHLAAEFTPNYVMFNWVYSLFLLTNQPPGEEH